MDEYSRIIIEEYCETHRSAKAKRLSRLIDLSYDVGAMPNDDDAVFLEKAIEAEKDDELNGALIDLDDDLSSDTERFILTTDKQLCIPPRDTHIIIIQHSCTGFKCLNQ
ncbi:MAG: hypothetical protein IJ807_02785 [Eubacterium sp.]|nr:hypothetical protein [Eubacterium sp.]